MPQFEYTGTDERVFLYPRTLVVSPGEVIEADESPDSYWFVPVANEPAPAKQKKGS